MERRKLVILTQYFPPEMGAPQSRLFETASGLVKLGWQVEVITAMLTKREWIGLSSDYDLFINTTNFDNTPVSVIEAMALGLPVVSTNVGGVPYLIENGVNGCLIEKTNVEDMFHSLSSILDNQSFAETLSRDARKKAEKFDWEHIKPLWLKVFEETQ